MPSTPLSALHQLNEQVAQLIAQGRYRDALPLAVDAGDSASARPAEGPGDELARAKALEQLGVLHRELGNYPLAEPPLLEALSVRGRAQGKLHPDYGRCLNELALLYEELAQYGQAEPLFKKALEVRRRALGEFHPDFAASAADLANLLDHLSRYAEAEALHQQARAIRQKGLGEEHPQYAQSLMAQAWTCWRRGQVRQAETLSRAAVEVLRRSLGELHPEYATAAHLLSRIALHQARLSEAEELALRVTDIRKKALGEGHHRYAGGLENLALVRAVQGRAEEAESLARQGVDITRAAVGERHPYVADGLAALAYALQTQHNYQEAERYYQQALDIYHGVHGEGHAHIASCRRDLAEVCLSRQRHAEAEEHYREARRILEPLAEMALMEMIEVLQGLSRVLAAQNQFDEAGLVARQAVDRARAAGDSPTLLASSLDALARVCQAQGRLAEAEPLWREVISCRARALGEAHPLYGESLRCLAGLYQMMGNFPEAQKLHEQALDILRRCLGERHPLYVQSLLGLAELCWQKGNLSEAENLYIRATEIESERVGEDHPEHAQAVSALARLYLAMNNIPAAEVRYRQVIDILGRTRGEEHPDYAQALHDLGTLHHQIGDLATAETLYAHARDIRKADPGEDHPDYAQSLHALAMVYQGMGQLDEAEPLFRQAVEIQRLNSGEDHPATLRFAHSLALFYQVRGDFRRAETQLSDVLRRQQATFGGGAPAIVPVLGDLARLYGGVGDQLAAEPLWRQALEINRAAFPEDHLLHAQDLVNLALCHRALGELAEAETLARESLEWVRKARGEEHPDVAAGLELLAGLALAQDRAGEAERLYLRALELTRQTLGHSHPAVASVLGDLAGLYAGTGRGDEAVALYRQACDIIRRAQGEDQAEYVTTQRQLAGVHQALGQYAEAEATLRQCLTILRRLFGPNNPMAVPAQQLLADTYRAQGRLGDAEKVCRQAVDTIRRWQESHAHEPSGSAGPLGLAGSLSLALAENNLAMIYLAQGKYALAEPLLRRALDGAREGAGEHHPAYLGTLFNLAGLCAATGRSAEALSLLEQLAEQDSRLLPQFLAVASERNRAFACHGCHEHYEAYLACGVRALASPRDDPRIAGQAPGQGVDRQTVTDRLYDLVLKRKRFGIEVLAVSPWPMWGERHPPWRAELRRLFLLDRQIGARRWEGPGGEGLAVHTDMLDAWLGQRESLESQLQAYIPGLFRRHRLREVSTAGVSAALPAGWALVEYVHYREGDFRNLSQRIDPRIAGQSTRPPGRYLVFVLRAGESPRLIDMGPAATIDGLALAWRRELTGGLRQSSAGKALAQAIWSGVEPLVAGCAGVVLAVDGELLHLPLDAMPLAEGCLLDRFQIRQVISGRDVFLGPEEDRRPTSGEPLVLGDPALSPPPLRGDSAMSRLWRMAHGVLDLSSSLLKGGGPRSEAEAVARLLGVRAYVGAAATRERAQGRRAPRVVHLSAPGFFLPERGTPVQSGTPGGEAELPPGAWENPLVRSGIPLAQGGGLTSYEITALDWNGTELVTLPACETPADLPGAWAKVSGLLSACIYAGARAVVLSLWRAPESARQELILTFYRHLQKGLPVAEALRAARLAVRARHPEPRYWAGWVCIGRQIAD